MTREEAIYEANENHNACYLDEFIDKIYDDFESMTCENCKWFSNDYGTCNLHGDLISSSSLLKCNSHKRIDDEL